MYFDGTNLLLTQGIFRVRATVSVVITGTATSTGIVDVMLGMYDVNLLKEQDRSSWPTPLGIGETRQETLEVECIIRVTPNTDQNLNFRVFSDTAAAGDDVFTWQISELHAHKLSPWIADAVPGLTLS